MEHDDTGLKEASMPTGPKAQPNSGVPRAKSTPTSPRFNHANLTPRTTILSQAAERVEAQRRQRPQFDIRSEAGSLLSEGMDVRATPMPPRSRQYTSSQ